MSAAVTSLTIGTEMLALVFGHSAICPSIRYSTIPPFRHSAIPPFRYSTIPPFRGQNPAKPRKGSMFCGKNLEIVSVRYRHHPRSSDACVGWL